MYTYTFIGSVQQEQIQCLAVCGKLVFAGYKNVIRSFKRGKEKSVYRGHEGEVHTLLPLGSFLLSVDDRNCIRIWDMREQGVVSLSKHAIHW